MTLEYSMDPQGRTRFYGIYKAKVTAIDDPLKKSRIKVQVPQVLGTDTTDWIVACLPVTSNGKHPDHKEHLASEIAAVLEDHTATFTSSSGGDPSHTHTVQVTFSHSGTAGEKLSHPHKVSADAQDAGDTTAEHTMHRKVPRVGQTVWVMFEAGDPEFPVWMGVLG